ncbi:hypothetical protein VB780_07190 [Leptolyngbya sp. CCNP1308]|uniref:hypothetical protein n=1 Tax=Leptolyngbya sp. CCNP1308 TaxID=3110255 RepID=UPI002B21BC32|nr:hypothetical protein [Leptolyngbya sp. CCNP1308]MEA5448346.1 hypothetical protein [Leptolyngbya sp. CCNP1308]
MGLQVELRRRVVQLLPLAQLLPECWPSVLALLWEMRSPVAWALNIRVAKMPFNIFLVLKTLVSALLGPLALL